MNEWKTSDGAELAFLRKKVHDLEARQDTEQCAAERQLLHICHVAANRHELIDELLPFFGRFTNCQAIGLRLHHGENFPYFKTRGFPQSFRATVNSLYTYDRQGGVIRNDEGDAVLECLCGDILSGRFDPAQPFFTTGGGFWTNSASEPPAATIITDITKRQKNGELLRARLRLSEAAATHDLKSLLRKITHYPLDKAGVWADCIRQGRAIIHNDYAALPHHRGMPANHVPLVRELTVPVIRNEKIVALLAVGNKGSDYDQEDIDLVTTLANLAWDIDIFTLTVADNGVGLPPGYDWSTAKTMGLTLVRMLGQHQLGGRYEIDRTEGTTFTLIFSVRNGGH